MNTKTTMAATERAAPAARKRKKGPRTVILTSIGLLVAIATLLAQRVAAGSDPVLGAVRLARAPQPVLVRHIVRRVIIETTVSSHSHVDARTYSSSPVITSQSSSGPKPAAPVTRSS
ncbi:MAG: hypothetical protein ACYDHN_05975 [Solirubrobacteraceae bacterium]